MIKEIKERIIELILEILLIVVLMWQSYNLGKVVELQKIMEYQTYKVVNSIDE